MGDQYVTSYCSKLNDNQGYYKYNVIKCKYCNTDYCNSAKDIAGHLYLPLIIGIISVIVAK